MKVVGRRIAILRLVFGRTHAMHRVGLAFSALLLAVSSATAAPKPDAAKFGWYSDYGAAKAEAKRTGKPIFLVFRCEP